MTSLIRLQTEGAGRRFFKLSSEYGAEAGAGTLRSTKVTWSIAETPNLQYMGDHRRHEVGSHTWIEQALPTKRLVCNELLRPLDMGEGGLQCPTALHVYWSNSMIVVHYYMTVLDIQSRTARNLASYIMPNQLRRNNLRTPMPSHTLLDLTLNRLLSNLVICLHYTAGRDTSLLSHSKPNTIGTQVINGVPLPQEGISKDGERSDWLCKGKKS